MKIKGLLPIAVIAVALIATFAMMKLKPEAPRRPIHKVIPAVSVYNVTSEVPQVLVRGFGTVHARELISVVPMVTGTVVDKNDAFENGGVVRKGDMLIQIEEADYQYNVQLAEAQVARAALGLAKAEQEAQIAKSEWNQLSDNNKKEKPNPLVLHTPQLKMAEAELQAAKAGLGQATLNLNRCKITAPFDGRVIEGNADIGQYIRAGNPIGVIHSIAEAEVSIPMDDKNLQFIDVPVCSGHAVAAKAEIMAEFAGKKYSWNGTVSRTSGDVDLKSRRVDVVLSVENPYHSSQQKPSLMEGMFVEAVIYGHKIDDASEIPRSAVKEDKVWLVSDSKIVFKDVEILHFDNENVVVRGLSAGDKVVTSHIEIVTNGMDVKIAGEVERGQNN